MSDDNPQPSKGSFWLSAAGVIGCFLIFAVVLYVAYLPSREAPTGIPANMTPEERAERGITTPEERRERLVTMRGKEETGLTGYQWIDKEKGVVLLPIDRAVELTVRELQAAENK